MSVENITVHDAYSNQSEETEETQGQPYEALRAKAGQGR